MLSPECLDDGGKALGELAASSGAHCSTAAGRSTNIRLVAVSHEVLCQRLCVGKALHTVIHTHKVNSALHPSGGRLIEYQLQLG